MVISGRESAHALLPCPSLPKVPYIYLADLSSPPFDIRFEHPPQQEYKITRKNTAEYLKTWRRMPQPLPLPLQAIRRKSVTLQRATSPSRTVRRQVLMSTSPNTMTDS